MSTVSTATTPFPQTVHHKQHASRLDRLKLPFMVITVALTGLGLIAMFVMALTWRQQPFLGVLLSNQMTVTAGTPSTGSDWAGLQAGLIARDHILSISNEDGTTSFALSGEDAVNYRTALSAFEIGDTISVNFERQWAVGEPLPISDTITNCSGVDNQTINCQATYTLNSFPDGDFLAFFLMPFLSGVVVFGIGVVLLMLRPEEPITFIVVIASMFLTWYMSSFFDVTTTYTLAPIWLATTTFLSGMILTIGILYPRPIALAQRFRWIQFLPTALGAGVTVIILGIFYSETPQTAGFAGYLANSLTLISIVALAVILFAYQRPRAINSAMRFQANILFLAVAMAMAPGLIWMVSRIVNTVSDFEGFRLTVEATMPFLVLPIIALAYVILEFQRFDTDKLIIQTMTYGVMLVALIAGYFLMILGVGLFVADRLDTRDPLIVALTLFAISVLFIPVRTRLQKRIDSYYFRVRHDYQARLEDFGRQLTSLVKSGAIIDAFRSLLQETINPENIFVFQLRAHQDSYVAFKNETDIAFTTTSGVARLLERDQSFVYLDSARSWEPELKVDQARINIVRAMIIAPLSSNNPITSFVTIGKPQSGKAGYRFEEIRFINNLIGQVTVALERSRVISSLENKVQELNVLSKVSQAVNFTVQQDDILELVITQTERLIPAKFFYVALFDSNIQQLHYAFFLEDEDRDRSKENRRWQIGGDLYSEIIQTARPLKVDNYVEIMRQRNYDLHYENHATQAWMGVPLIAGTGVLGVLALGDNDREIAFTDDQLSILSDIGSLAATSLDKNRLFTQTETRARQLTALNEISRQLVAAEANVEKLLELVTESAVEILNAEAGSLLLMTDDVTRDLEFRAVVGETGASLLGTRLKRGFGLVGEVAESGDPIISNEIEKDERFDGEVVKEGFHTSSILAVPLIAQDRTIGVLEVINKVDGTYFDVDDQSLLITFAGQAAIALENARLFQSTDEQLSQRVRELENLERFANELNKALELGRVAELTIQAALEASYAQAGLLCLVDETQTHLKVVKNIGFPDEVLPDGAYDGEWIVKEGIVGRVIRTRSSDLAPDVAIDPDYLSGLPGAISQLTFPMLAGKLVNAILVLETNHEPRFNLLHQLSVQRLIEHASIAIQNAQLYENLRLADKTKSEFVGFAAHELKNPLTSVKGYAAVMNSVTDVDKIKSMAKIIVNNADRMQSIIDDMRDIAMDDADLLKIEAAPISFRSVVLDTLMPFQKQLDEKSQSVENAVRDDLPLVMGDKNKLIQVLTNFVSNAHKYSNEDTTITVGAGVIRRYVNKQNKVLGDMLHIYIQDQGFGIKEEDLGKLFKESYFRSTNEKALSEKGTGLGMIITQRLIKLHGGEIWVESVYGEGSTFHFVIPLAPENIQPRDVITVPLETTTSEPASD